MICVRHSLYIDRCLSGLCIGLCSAKLEAMTNMILTFVVSLVVSGLLVSSARVSEADANHDATLLNEAKIIVVSAFLSIAHWQNSNVSSQIMVVSTFLSMVSLCT